MVDQIGVAAKATGLAVMGSLCEVRMGVSFVEDAPNGFQRIYGSVKFHIQYVNDPKNHCLDLCRFFLARKKRAVQIASAPVVEEVPAIDGGQKSGTMNFSRAKGQVKTCRNCIGVTFCLYF